MFIDIVFLVCILLFFFFFKQKTAYEMRISDWSSDVCSSDLVPAHPARRLMTMAAPAIFFMSDPFEKSANQRIHSVGVSDRAHEIGRASCRERVCPYV